MNETALQNQIRMALSEYGMVWRLNVGTTKTIDGRYINTGLPPGTPDLLFIGKGFIMFLEIKTEKGRLRDAQKNMAARLAELEQYYVVVRSVDEAVKAVENVINVESLVNKEVY